MSSILLPVHHRKQRNSGECLAASASMVLAYMGISVSYKRLLKLLEIRWFGTPSFKIRNLNKLRLTVIYKQGTLAELRHHLQQNRPCIAFVKTRDLPYWTYNTDHAVVVVGMDNLYIYLNDPAFNKSPIPVSHGDFDLAWFEREEFYAVLMRRN